MGSYQSTRTDLIEFLPQIKHDLPLAVCDRSLAYHLGLHNSTLWMFALKKDTLYDVFSISKRGKHKW